MKPPNLLKALLTLFGSLGVLALTAGTAAAGIPAGTATMGPANPNAQITVTVWLNLHNKAQLDALVRDMYDSSSPSFHHFLTLAQYQAQFAPSAADAQTAQNFLASHNLRVVSTDPMNHYVIAQGRVADAQAAFSTEIQTAMVAGKKHRVTTKEASVPGVAGGVVAAVQGLSDLGYSTHIRPAHDLETGAAFQAVSISSVGPDGLFFSADCLRPPELQNFTTNGGTPSATYFGNRYGADITNTVTGTLPSCGYDAQELQTAYGLNAAYAAGLDGTGQTIVIVDGFGSNTILSDANLFSSLNGLPLLTAANFTIYTPNGSATCTATNGCISGNWQYETTLDVEWAHSMAPGASIALVLGADNTFTNLDIANLFAIENGLGNVVSNSFGIQEIALVELAPSELVVENGISEIAAALGISHDISTGDSGDNLISDNADFGIDSVSVDTNADSPYATAVGGSSTFLDSRFNIKLQTGWGLNFTRVAEPTPNPPTIPPLQFGFQEGAGGGTSVVYAKPKFQKHLPGKFRMLPDVSMDADPETGVEIIVTADSVVGDPPSVAVFGGTSLSTPMFSGVWAIANQANALAGGGSLGQAAPLLYELPAAALHDVNVTPIDTIFNVIGVIDNPPAKPQFVNSDALLSSSGLYLSTLFQSSSSTRWDVFGFGLDSSLSTGPGWDNVTGVGEPNGMKFIKAVVKAANK